MALGIFPRAMQHDLHTGAVVTEQRWKQRWTEEGEGHAPAAGDPEGTHRACGNVLSDCAVHSEHRVPWVLAQN